MSSLKVGLYIECLIIPIPKHHHHTTAALGSGDRAINIPSITITASGLRIRLATLTEASLLELNLRRYCQD